jgi:hypothetical protein
MMKASPAARSWIAAGVRHELLTRVLPALRHDMVGPVSVMRMGMLMLKRQVESSSIDSQACTERVALIDDQIGQLIAGVRSLRNWELATTDEGTTRSALVEQCVALLRPAFSLHGVQLEIAPSLQPRAGEPCWPRAAALRYLLLCGLSYLHDAGPVSGTITLAADDQDALTLRMRPSLDGAAEQLMLEGAAAHRAPRRLAIDAVALQSLADDLGYEVTVSDDATVRFSLAARQ